MTGVLEGLRAALADRYHVEHELGHGAMATVYLAQDLRLHRRVAVKVLLPYLSAALGPERFLREISIIAGFNHPNILPLFDSGEADGLLYYVMPYVEGESLQDRLLRERQLPVPAAVSIARQILEGLGYAHSLGIVHRDVKPANIMLSGDRALVADFGIARAIRRAASEERLTETGIALGTPAYMSPEQAGGESELDGRSDLYATGCVLYEMLTGEPPFKGSTAQAILARHQLDPVPPIRTVRRSVSVEVEQAVLRALEKVPADRYTTASEFTGALDAPPAPAPVKPRSWRRAVWSAGVAGAGLIIYLAIKGLVSGGEIGAAGLDTTRYAILPFERDSRVGPFNEDQLLHDALTRWTGIAVVDPFQVRDAMARRGGRPLTSNEALVVAAGLGAGRYIRGQVSRVGDSVRVNAGMYDVTRPGGPLLREKTLRLAPDLGRAEPSFADLGDGLLFGSEGPGARLEGRTGTSSFPARREFARGLDSIYSWNLAAADSAFSVATRLDQNYAQAFVWVAQTRSWMAQGRSWVNTPTATWQSAAERAAAGRARLSSRDQLLSDALLALSRGEVVPACRTWTRLTRLDPFDFATWYGLGNCLSRDDVVMRDPVSPSGWRFRSSYHQATSAYVRAFQLLPSIHRSLRLGSYERLRDLLKTSGHSLRMGRALPPDTTTFGAYPSWQGDTLAFLPYPENVALRRPDSEATILAIRHQRQLFHEIATAWVTAFPQSADAVEALAISLEMLGDPTALDTLRRARSLAVSADERLRVAGSEVWMQVRYSVPLHLAGVRAARALADSLLRGEPPERTTEPLLLSTLASLTGRAQLAAAFSLHPAATAEWKVPGPLAETALPLLIFAALGGPPDTLLALEHRVDSIIENVLPNADRRDARLEWLARPATLAFPDRQLRSVAQLAGSGDYLLDAQAAFAGGDTAAVRRLFATLRTERRYTPPGTLTFDALYPEAWLLAALGDSQEAIAWLGPTLSSLSSTAPQVLVDPSRAAALVRAMALRAELAARRGDRTGAAVWARAVGVLWSDADPFLQPIVRRMQRLMENR